MDSLRMIGSRKLVCEKSELGYLVPISQLTFRSRGAPSMTLLRRLPAFRMKSAPAFYSSFCSDFRIPAKLKFAAMEIKGSSACGGAVTSVCSISLSAETLRWVITGAATLLMLVRNTAIRKSFLAPVVALQAPREVITWMRGEYGLWAAFLALLVRLFYYIPGELELPLMLLLLVITAPYQAMDLRGTTGATAACACVAAFLAYQHFSGTGVKNSLKDGAILASIAVICLVGAAFALLSGRF